MQQDRALQVAEELLVGLDYIHSRDIAHRDIKPDNIMLGYDGTVKVSDYGLAYSDNGVYGIQEPAWVSHAVCCGVLRVLCALLLSAMSMCADCCMLGGH